MDAYELEGRKKKKVKVLERNLRKITKKMVNDNHYFLAQSEGRREKGSLKKEIYSLG